MLNYRETDRAVIDHLKTIKKPIHYREAVNYAVWSAAGGYSDKVDPAEKLRQHYGENRAGCNGILFIKGGYLALNYWFPNFKKTQSQLSLLSPPEAIYIDGDCLVSYDSGFEQAMREPYLYDHYGDGNTIHRRNTRRSGALVQDHVKYFFRSNWPDFYRGASNENQYDQYAHDDFKLITPFHSIIIDVKKVSYNNNYGQPVNVVRGLELKQTVIYISGEWTESQRVRINGIFSSDWLKMIGDTGNGTYHVSANHLWSIDVLVVLLNMAKIRLNYNDYHRRLKTDK